MTQQNEEAQREKSDTSLLRDVNETFNIQLIPGQPEDHMYDVLVCAIDADMKEETLQIWTDWANKSGDEPDASWSLPVMSAISKHEGLVLGTMGLEHIRGAALSCSMTVGVFSPSDLGSAVALVAAYNILYKGQTYEEALKKLYDNTLSKFQGEKGTSPLNDMELYLNRVMTVELRSSLAAFELKAERIRSILSPLAVKSFYAFQRLVAERKTRDRQRADKPRVGTMDEAIDVKTETNHFRNGFPVDANFKTLTDTPPQPAYPHSNNTSRSRVNSDSITSLLSEDFTSIMRRPSAVGGPSSSMGMVSHRHNKATSGRSSMASMSSTGKNYALNRNSIASTRNSIASTSNNSYRNYPPQQNPNQPKIVTHTQQPPLTQQQQKAPPVMAKSAIGPQVTSVSPKTTATTQQSKRSNSGAKVQRSVSPISSSMPPNAQRYRISTNNNNESLNSTTTELSSSQLISEGGSNLTSGGSLNPSATSKQSTKLKHNQIPPPAPTTRPVLVRPDKAVKNVLDDGRRSIESYGIVRRADRRSPERHVPAPLHPRMIDRNMSSSVSSVSSSRSSLAPSPFTPRTLNMSSHPHQNSYFSSQPNDPFNTSLLRMSQTSQSRGPTNSHIISSSHNHNHGHFGPRMSLGLGSSLGNSNGEKKSPFIPPLSLPRSRDILSTASLTSYRDEPFKGPDVDHLDEPRANGHLIMTQKESGSFFKKRGRWGCQFG